MIDVKTLKRHAAQKFIEECHVDTKGPGQCNSSGKNFKKVRRSSSQDCPQVVHIFYGFPTWCPKLYLQGEPRVIINDDGQEEAYSLAAACTLLAPLLKQGRNRKNRALDIKVCTWRAICHRILIDARIVKAAAVCRSD